jgi:hypothetical protein
MLPPFIIDQIRRREEEEERRQQDREQPRLELPVDAYGPGRRPRERDEDEDQADGGVVILDLG